MRIPALVALLAAGLAAPVSAQSGGQSGASSGAATSVPQRVDRLEREMRAVQRKVFPGGSQQFFEAEIAPPQATGPAPGTPVGSPVADLTARVDTLERELSRLTGQAEQNAFKLRQIEDSLNRFKGDTEFRLNAVEGGAPAAGTPGTAAQRPAPFRDQAPASAPGGAPASAPASAAREPVAEAAPLPPVPSTGDAGEDAYMAGYRLWEARRYPEAATALKAAVARYPGHKRASYAQNLLGRTYLDSGRPAAAAVAFHKNFTGNPRGERAPDSLYFLGQSLMKLDKPNPTKACEAYGALLREYDGTISGDLRAKVAKGQADARCKAGG